MQIRFVTMGDFFDRDLPAVPSVGDTIRTYDHPGQVSPRLSFVRSVIWDIPTAPAPLAPDWPAGDPLPVSVEVHLTNKPPRGH